MSRDAVTVGGVEKRSTSSTHSTESVGDILGRLCRSTSWGGRLAEGQALNVWSEVVGDSLREHTQPLRVRDGKMIVAVRDSVWKQEISLLHEELIQRLNEKIGRPLINDVVLIVR